MLFLLDTSGSMRGVKLDEAKGAISTVTTDLAGSFHLGFRQLSGSCGSPGELLIPVGPVDEAAFVAEVNGLTAGGGTPTSAALRLAATEVPPGGTVVLVADGDDQCGDLCTTATELAALDVSFTVHLVGVQVAGPVADEMQCAADATGGQYVDISDPASLTEAIKGVIGGGPCGLLDPVICYAPELRFDSGERFYPMSVDNFVLNAELKWAAGSACPDELVAADPVPERLTDQSYSAQERSNLLCRRESSFFSNEFTRPFSAIANNGTERALRDNGADRVAEKEGFYLRWTGDQEPFGDPVGTAPVYVERVGATIEYWFFYGFDPKSNDFDGVVSHEGDWERIVVTPPAGDIGGQVEYYGHNCDPARVLWADLELVEATHPVVYVAQGAHASYPEVHTPPDPCGGALGLEGVADVADGNGPHWRTWEGSQLVTANTQCWYGYGGAWGDTSGRWGVRGHATGPGGLPYQSSGTQPNVHQPAVDPCLRGTDGIGVAPEPGFPTTFWDRIFEWLMPVTIEFQGGSPGVSYTTTLQSVPVLVDVTEVRADGVTVVEFVVPPGTPPGPHRLVIQRTDTGEEVFVSEVWVDAPTECLTDTSAPGQDVDGDTVIDLCDPNPGDGPAADLDGDGVANGVDNCPSIANPDQARATEWRTPGISCDFRLGANTVPHHQVLPYIDGPFCSWFVPTVIGTDGDDEIVGTNKRDVIWGGDGADIITGLSGDDVICGGPGADIIAGGNGEDDVRGGQGPDQLNGGNGADELLGQGGNDQLDGGNGPDQLDGGLGDDHHDGGRGPDVVDDPEGQNVCVDIEDIVAC